MQAGGGGAFGGMGMGMGNGGGMGAMRPSNGQSAPFGQQPLQPQGLSGASTQGYSLSPQPPQHQQQPYQQNANRPQQAQQPAKKDAFADLVDLMG